MATEMLLQQENFLISLANLTKANCSSKIAKMPPELSLDPELSSQHKHRLELSKSTKFPSKSLTILPDLKPSKNHTCKKGMTQKFQ